MPAALDSAEHVSEFEELYNKNKDRLYRIAYGKLHNVQDAEDAVSECFYRIFNKTANIFAVSPNKRRAYLNVVIRNVCAEMFNKSNAKNTVSVNDDDNFQNDIADDVDLENEVISKISKEKLIEFINRMSDKLRDSVILTAVMGFSYREAAEQLGITENNLRQRIFEARKQIRSFIDSQG